MTTYRVMLEGSALPGFAPDEVRRRLAALIGRGEDTAARLLGGRASTVKKGIDEPTGLRYVDALKRIGVACHLEHETLDLDLESLRTAPLSSVAGGASLKSASPASVGAARVVRKSTPTSFYDTAAFKLLGLVVSISLIIGAMFLFHVATGPKSPSSPDESPKTTLLTPEQKAQEDRIRAEIASTKAAGEARDAAMAAKFKAERGDIIAKLKQLIAARKYQEAIGLADGYAWAKDRELDALKEAAVDKNREVIIAKEKAERKKQGVSIGMTQDEVIESSWGKPRKINRTTTANHIHEQWVYGEYGEGLLYFDDGILTAIQN